MGSPGVASYPTQTTGKALVTAVATSCGRFDLLRETLSTFFAVNTCPLAEIIVVEDGPSIPEFIKTEFSDQGIKWLTTGSRVGQIIAIDLAYSKITTPWIFHLEDDWHFYRSGFIEPSLEILQQEPSCLQVQIRAHRDTNGHPIGADQEFTGNIGWKRLLPEYNYDGNIWHGFSFNPGLRRLADYRSIGRYGDHVKFDYDVPWEAERRLGVIYHQRGFFTAILSGECGDGYVRHIGRGRRVKPPTSP